MNGRGGACARTLVPPLRPPPPAPVPRSQRFQCPALSVTHTRSPERTRFSGHRAVTTRATRIPRRALGHHEARVVCRPGHEPVRRDSSDIHRERGTDGVRPGDRGRRRVDAAGGPGYARRRPLVLPTPKDRLGERVAVITDRWGAEHVPWWAPRREAPPVRRPPSPGPGLRAPRSSISPQPPRSSITPHPSPANPANKSAHCGCTSQESNSVVTHPSQSHRQ